MRVFNKGTLNGWVEKYVDSESGLYHWHKIVSRAEWKTTNAMLLAIACDVISVKAKAGLPSGFVRVIFDIAGNNYRLMAHVSFEKQTIFLKWFGTHAAYDKIDFNIYNGG